MIEQWQPANADTTQPDLTILNGLAAQVEQFEQDAQLETLMDPQQSQQLRSWTQLSEAQWLPILEQINQPQLLQIATFYVVAEAKLSGWECGDSNPAIWIFRYLKKTAQLPEKHIIKSLKSKTDNRFIPYGNVLG